MPVDRDILITRSPTALGTDVSDLHVVLTDDLRYLGLNPVAARVWELLATPSTLAQLVDQLTEEYEVEPEQCEREVGALIEQLAQHKLVSLGA